MYLNTDLAKIDLCGSENYQILHDCITLKYLKSKFLKILLGEEENMHGWIPSGEPLSVLDL